MNSLGCDSHNGAVNPIAMYITVQWIDCLILILSHRISGTYNRFHHRMNFLALPATTPIPPDQFIAGYCPVGDNPRDLIPGLSPVHGRKEKPVLQIHLGKIRLFQGLSKRHVPTLSATLLSRKPVRDETDLGKIQNAWEFPQDHSPHRTESLLQ